MWSSRARQPGAAKVRLRPIAAIAASRCVAVTPGLDSTLRPGPQGRGWRHSVVAQVERTRYRLRTAVPAGAGHVTLCGKRDAKRVRHINADGGFDTRGRGGEPPDGRRPIWLPCYGTVTTVGSVLIDIKEQQALWLVAAGTLGPHTYCGSLGLSISRSVREATHHDAMRRRATQGHRLDSSLSPPLTNVSLIGVAPSPRMPPESNVTAASPRRTTSEHCTIEDRFEPRISPLPSALFLRP